MPRSFGMFHSPFHKQLTQIRPIQTNVKMGHRVEKQWWTLHVDEASRVFGSKYEANDEHMARYLAIMEDRLKKLDEWVIRRVPRKKNVKTDALAEIVATLPIKEAMMLSTGDLPENRKQAHKLHIQAARFTFINDQLYRRSFGGPYRKCLSEPEAKYVLAKLHEGVYDNHSGRQTLAHRAYPQGDGHSRPFAHCSNAKELFARCNRLLQEVGGGRSLCQHQR
ncbi:hypothetical protein AAG906_019454 [Vitis piasezkii]